MWELRASVLAAKVRPRPKSAECAFLGGDDTRAIEPQLQSVLSAARASLLVGRGPIDDIALELDVAEIRPGLPSLPVKREAADTDARMTDDLNLNLCRVEVGSAHPAAGHPVLWLYFHQGFADRDRLSPGVANRCHEFVTKQAHLGRRETLALTGPAVELIVMVEAQVHQVVERRVGGVAIQVGNLSGSDARVPIQAETDGASATAGGEHCGPRHDWYECSGHGFLVVASG